MEKELEDLADLLSRKKEESSLTIKWAAVPAGRLLACERYGEINND